MIGAYVASLKWGADHTPESESFGHSVTATSLQAGSSQCVAFFLVYQRGTNLRTGRQEGDWRKSPQSKMGR